MATTFEPNTAHCTTCNTTSPTIDEDGYTTCCNDTVCVTNAEGRCERCNPLCGICGFEMTDGYDIDARGRQVHFDRQCPTGQTPKKPAPKRTRTAAVKSPERRLAESAGVVSTTTVETPLTLRQYQHAGTSHSNCDHPATKSARAACRRKRTTVAVAG